MKGLMTAVLLQLLLFAMVAQPSAAAETKLSEGEARDLLRVFLKSKGYDTKAAPLDIETSSAAADEAECASAFYLFAVFVDTPQRLVKLGNYGINSTTGDIWNLVECKRVTSKAIAHKQGQIRKSSGLSSADLRRARKAPVCCF